MNRKVFAIRSHLLLALLTVVGWYQYLNFAKVAETGKDDLYHFLMGCCVFIIASAPGHIYLQATSDKRRGKISWVRYLEYLLAGVVGFLICCAIIILSHFYLLR